MSNLTVFQFESKEVRFLGTAFDPWWVAGDICRVLGLGVDTHKHVQKLKPNEKTRKSFPGVDNPDGAWCVNEKGLYRLIFRSNKPNAEAFQDWVFGEVLPAIRKTGKYELPQAQQQPTLPAPTGQPALPPSSPPAPPTPQQISELFDLTLGQSGLDPKLIAGVKLSAIARIHPQFAAAAELGKPALGVEVEDALLTPTRLAEILSENNNLDLTARAINQLLLDVANCKHKRFKLQTRQF